MAEEASRKEFIKTAGFGVAGPSLLHHSTSHATKHREKKVEMTIATISQWENQLVRYFNPIPLY